MAGDLLYIWRKLRPDQPPLTYYGPCAETRTGTWWPVGESANTIIKADAEGQMIIGVAPNAAVTGDLHDVVIGDDDLVYRVQLKAGEAPAWFDYVMISDQADGSVAVLAAPAAPGTNYACGIVVDYTPVSGGICHIIPVFHMLDASLTTQQT